MLPRDGQTTAKKLKKAVDGMAPHAGRHGVLGSQALESRARGGMLACQEEVMMLVQESAVKGDECLPLLVVQGVGVLVVRLKSVDLDALALDQDKTGVYALDLRHELFFAYRPGFRLLLEGQYLAIMRGTAPVARR